MGKQADTTEPEVDGVLVVFRPETMPATGSHYSYESTTDRAVASNGSMPVLAAIVPVVDNKVPGIQREVSTTGAEQSTLWAAGDGPAVGDTMTGDVWHPFFECAHQSTRSFRGTMASSWF